ncbi:hypothetical protein ACHMW6_06490 [Pseudoduganella sp. UC29_106]|uniref:hypothetical protein n=1 Tax=Pseudoduganella sp. UC29_106 TaxID=3374553 RepID=UPI003756D27B
MTDTANLAVTKIDSAQAQKEVTANEAFDVFDAALSGLTKALSDANYTLSTATVPQEWQYGVIKFTGTLTAGRNIIVPTNKKQYTIINATSGGFALTVKTSGGTGVAVSAGVITTVYCDGTNVVAVTPGAGAGTVTSVNITAPAAGITVSGGPVTTSGAITLTLADDLAALEALSGTGILERTGANTYALRILDTDGTMAANSATRIPSQSALVTYVDSRITGGASDVMIFKGLIDCSLNPNYPAADAGNLYKISVAGKIGGVSGPNVEAGDTIYCITDSSASGTHAGVGANWAITQVNLDGAVTGPASATDNHVAFFNGATGKIVKDSGLTLAGTNTGDETATTIGALISSASAKTTPVDADYLGLMDSAASNILKKVSWANIKATLKSYFDTLYAPLTQPAVLSFFYPGAPTASALVGHLIAPAGISTLTFAAAIAGSSGKALTAATAQTDFDVRKNATTSSGGTSVGTIRFAASGTVPTFIAASGFSLTGGTDYLTVWAPATPDATLADIGVGLYATR